MAFFSSAAMTMPIASSSARYHGRIGAALLVAHFFIEIQIFPRRLQGRLRRIEGQVQEQRLGGIVFLDDARGFLADQRGAVAFFPDQPLVSMPVGLAQLVGLAQAVDVAVEAAVKTVESALRRPVFFLVVTQLPLAERWQCGSRPLSMLATAGARRWAVHTGSREESTGFASHSASGSAR